MELLLKNLLREAKENRINLMKISTLMEKILPELTDFQSKKVTEMFEEVSLRVSNLNALPYTKFNVLEWQSAIVELYEKIMELREKLAVIAEDNKDLHCTPLIDALDEVLKY